MSDVQRASFGELLEFANKVREAGGGNPLDALMPATPVDEKQCLVAKNLNFNCEVNSEYLQPSDLHRTWVMMLDDAETADKIGEALGLDRADIKRFVDVLNEETGEEEATTVILYAVVLPPEIAQVAKDFDRWSDVFSYDYKNQRYYVSDEYLDEFKEFLPYVEKSYHEALQIGVFNSKGELIQ